jgi:hypothetical protein
MRPSKAVARQVGVSALIAARCPDARDPFAIRHARVP